MTKSANAQRQIQDQSEAVVFDKRVRLLLIDDDVQDAESLRKAILNQADIDLFHCADRSQALNTISEICPTVILLALDALNVNPAGLVDAFRQQQGLGDVPIIVFCAKCGETEIRESVFSAGANDCLTTLSSGVEIVSRVRYYSHAYTDHRLLQENIENLENLRAQMMHSEKMASIGQLAAGVAHEINNPIAFVTSNINSMDGYYEDVFSIISAYEQLEDVLPDDVAELKAVKEIKERLQLGYMKDDIKQILKECKDGLTRVHKIVDDLKNFSREEKIEWQLANLHKVLDSALNIANHEIKYKAEVNKDYCDIPDIQCVPSQLNQVFLNLLVNAAQAIEDHGSITLTTLTGALPEQFCDSAEEIPGNTDSDSWVCVKIADTGNGIGGDAIQQIFDPFFTTKPVGKGTGLGLSLSRNIVRKHSGYISVESEQGKGTTFSVWLPVQQIEHADS